jgi:hypothetical protein
MRDLRQHLDVDDVDERIAEGFGVEQLGVGLDCRGEFFRMIRMDKRRFDSQLVQIHPEQGVRAAVKRGGRHDVVAALAQREDCRRFGRLAGGAGERRAAVLQRRHALLEHRHGRVGNARVDVAEGLQVEQACRVVRGVEHERGGLVDWRRARAGGRVRNLARVQAKGLEAELAVRHG